MKRNSSSNSNNKHGKNDNSTTGRCPRKKNVIGQKMKAMRGGGAALCVVCDACCVEYGLRGLLCFALRGGGEARMKEKRKARAALFGCAKSARGTQCFDRLGGFEPLRLWRRCSVIHVGVAWET